MRDFLIKIKNNYFFGFLYLASICAGAAARVYLALQAPEKLLYRQFPDEAFFYLRLGRNFASGLGSTFDGENLTSGFHPLWVWMLSAVYKLFPDYQGAYFTASLFLQAALGLAGAFFLWKTLCLLTDNKIFRWLGLTLYLLNPHVIFLTMSGMDTALTVFLISVFLFLFFKWVSGRVLGEYFYITTGGVGGLLFLARTDSAFLIGMVFAAMLIKEKQRWKTIKELLVPSAVVVLPWVIWSFATFGTLLQASAYAPTIGRRMATGANMAGFNLRDILWLIKYSLWSTRDDIVSLSGIVSMRLPLLLLSGVGLAILGFRPCNESDNAWYKKIFFWYLLPFSAFSILFGVHSLIRWYNREYYTAPWNLLAVIFAVMVFEGMRRIKLRGAAAIICGFAVMAAVSYVFTYRNVYRVSVNASSGTISMMMTTKWANENLPEGARLGNIKTAGTLNFWSRFHAENLDGKENNAVIPFIREGRLWDYMKEHNLGYLMETDKAMVTRHVFYDKSANQPVLEPVYHIDEEILGYPIESVTIFKLNFK